MNGILRRLEDAYPDRVRVSRSLDQTEVYVPAAEIAGVVAFLKSEGLRMLIDLTAVDHPDREPRFDVVYHLYHIERRRWLRLVVPVGGDEPRVQSITHIFAAANWAERECFDMFGIRFDGHPDLRRILMPDDWRGHPLRKDYPLRGTDPWPSPVRE